MRLYLDAAPVTYLVERTPGFFAAVQSLLSQPGAILIASDLTRMECRVLPVRNGDAALIQAFDRYFREVVTEIVPLSGADIDQATEIRAEHGFRTPDALHLAAAVIAGCDEFITNDHRLDRFRGIPIVSVM